MPPALALTVVIPSRNCLAYLPAALDSVAAQAAAGIEVIVVDDGSTDGTWAWLQGAARLNPQVRPLRLEGAGVQAARNLAVVEARAPLVAFLDADDVWRPGKLRGQLAFHAAHPDLVLSFTDYLHVDPEGGSHGTCFAFWPRFARAVRRQRGWRRLDGWGGAAILAENAIGTSTVAVRRDAFLAVGGFDAGLGSASDWDLWLKLASVGPLACTDEVAADYLMRPNSISGNRDARIRAMVQIIERHGQRLAANAPAALAAAWARVEVARAEVAREKGRCHEAARAHLRALRLAPCRRTARAFLSDALRCLRALAGTQASAAS